MRFSMCNCVTLYFPQTYTAHAMTMDFFINKVTPGVELLVPHTNLWPSGYVRKYKIPKVVDTFLFSPFNESFHPSYLIDGTRYQLGPHKGLVELKKIAQPIPRLSLDQFSDSLLSMEKHAKDIWGNQLKTILLFYDASRIKGTPTYKRVTAYDEAAEKTLGWKVLRVNEPKCDKPRWCHYSNNEQARLVKELEKLEK